VSLRELGASHVWAVLEHEHYSMPLGAVVLHVTGERNTPNAAMLD
jgi:hypothetical protein